MLVGPPRNFHCPACGALYKLVRVPKPEVNEAPNKSVFCVHCHQPLAPEDDGFVLKYLMVWRPHERERRDDAPRA